MMAFIWVALVYVILAFTDITASTFVGRTEDLAGLAVRFNPGGAVALASVLYLLLSIVMGLVERYLQPPLWLTTLVFVPATLVVVWLGTRFSTLLVLDGAHLGRPHPRLLLRGLARRRCGRCSSRAATWAASSSTWRWRVGVIGIFLGGFEIQQEAFKTWQAPGADGRAVPVPVRDHRLRRLLGLPRPRLLGHHLEADRARVALPARWATAACCSRASWP